MLDAAPDAGGQILYRGAEERDLAALAAMYARLNGYFRQFPYHFPEVPDIGQAWLDSFRRTLGRFSMVYVAELDGRLVGFVLGRVKRVAPYLGGVLVGELSDIWVEPDARRLHIGAGLSRRIVAWLRQQGVHSVETQVLEGNEPIRKLFEKEGFQPELRQLRLTWEDETPDA